MRRDLRELPLVTPHEPDAADLRSTKVTCRRAGSKRVGSGVYWVRSRCCADHGAMRGSNGDARFEAHGSPVVGDA